MKESVKSKALKIKGKEMKKVEEACKDCGKKNCICK